MKARYQVSIETSKYLYSLWDCDTKKQAIKECRTVAKNGSCSFSREELKKDGASIYVYDTQISEIVFVKGVK